MELGVVDLDIQLDWAFDEFSHMSKMYIQCYSLIYSLSDIELPSAYEKYNDFFKAEYANYPWKGGYSVVNFYRSIFNKIPFEHRPEIVSINYNSPGKIKLKEIVEVAAALAAIVASVTISIDNIHDSYNKIQKGMSDRKLTKIELNIKELELKEKEMHFIEKSIEELTKAMDINEELKKALENKSGGNKLMQLKILMSLYRRIEPLAMMQDRGSLNLDTIEKRHLTNKDR
ncbi:MAG: hypothetical protein KAT62_02495 [Desulfuromonadales bacterium]|nr:hypothetical protein [Desulfuromonadales bacterium]